MAEDLTRPYFGAGEGERRKAALARKLREKPYENTRMDDYLGGIFGADTSGSVLDPDRAQRVQANDIGQKLGIGLDVLDAKALLSAGGAALLGAVKNVGKKAAGKAAGKLAPKTAVSGVAALDDAGTDALSKALRESGMPEKKLPPINELVQPKVSARGPSVGTPKGDEKFRAKYGRDPIYAMDEATRVKNFGPAYAESPEVWMSDLRSRKPLMIPGGLEGDLTLADSAKISAQGIDYNDLDPRLAQAIHEKLVRSVDPGANMPDTERMGRLMFGITSGNAPITKNLIEYAQMRPRNSQEIADWARYSPVGPDKTLPTDYRNELNRAINEAYGVQAAGRGGTGVANTANRQYVSDLAKMYTENPAFFVKAAGETEPQFVERLMNQVRGLGPKTGSLGMAMLEPQTTNISAIDRHIADITRGAVSQDPAALPIYERRMLQAMNKELPASKRASSLETARARVGGRGKNVEDIEGDRFRDIVSSPESMVFREKRTGEINPAVPEHLRNLPFYEPKQASTIGPLYEAALRNIQAGGEKLGLGGFSAQWFPWDYQRSRAEPHAALNKMAGSTPRLAPEEYAMARDTFSKAGAFRTTKDKATGRLSPLKSDLDNWRKYLYGQATPLGMGVAAGAAGAGAYAAQDEDVQDLLQRLAERMRLQEQ